MHIAQPRPPFVEFKQVAKHDPKASIEKGYRVTKNLDMALIMQPGSRDQVEIEATAWLASIKRKHLEGTADAFPQEWVDGFHKKYEMWQKGLEAPLMGTSVREWPILSPAEAENFISAGILTIQDVSEMTEESLGRLGLGSREKREKAREWLKTKELAGNALAENEELKKQLAEMQAQIAELMADKPTRGRKPKEQ